MSKILLLPPNVAKIAKVAAAHEHCRYGATTGIQVSKQNGKYKIEATNGRIAAIITGTPEKPEDYPSCAFLDAAPNGATSAVVPAKVWEKGFRDLPRKAAKPILGNLAVVLGKQAVTLSCTDLETTRAVQPRVVEGRFPDTDKILPQGEPQATVRVSIAYLRSLLDVAESVNESVTFEVYEGNRPMALRGKHPDSDQEFLGLIVPLVTEADAKPQPKAFNGVSEATPVEEETIPMPEEPADEEKPKRRQRAAKVAAAAASLLLGTICFLGRWLSAG